MERKKNKIVWRPANISDMPFNQKSPVHREVGFPRWHNNRRTLQLTDWPGTEGRVSENMELLYKGLVYSSLLQSSLVKCSLV